jgi:hypothetical protein
MPSSLTRVLPFPLVYSTHLPVSVCGTVTQDSLGAFLGSSAQPLLARGPAITDRARRADLPTLFIALAAWHLSCPFGQAGLPNCVTPSRLCRPDVVPEY